LNLEYQVEWIHEKDAGERRSEVGEAEAKLRSVRKQLAEEQAVRREHEKDLSVLRSAHDSDMATIEKEEGMIKVKEEMMEAMRLTIGDLRMDLDAEIGKASTLERVLTSLKESRRMDVEALNKTKESLIEARDGWDEPNPNPNPNPD